jgi:hypothetical protein
MTKRLLFSGCLLLLCIFLFAEANGSISQFDGKTILKVWGTHSERGYAQGFLIGDRILDVYDAYIIHTLVSNNANTYATKLAVFESEFDVDSIFVDEAQGVIDGMDAAGFDRHNDTLDRDIDATDLLFANAVVDIAYLDRSCNLDLGCSSLSAWGGATPDLSGERVFMRLLDWTPNSTLTQHPLLLVEFPSETNEQPWLCFTYPGLFGALSAINAQGTVCMMNVGNVHDCPNPADLSPILLTLRSAIESADPNGDGHSTAQDVFYEVSNRASAVGAIIHAADETDSSSIVIETNNTGTVFRTDEFDDGLPANTIAATNHFRSLAQPVTCSRYNKIVDSLSASPYLDEDRAWKLLKGAGGVSTNMMAIEYSFPGGWVRWATRAGSTPAYQRPYIELSLSRLFDPTGLVDTPAPQQAIRFIAVGGNGSVTLDYGMTHPGSVEFDVYDLRGRRIETVRQGVRETGRHTTNWATDRVSSGLYLFRMRIDGHSVAVAKAAVVH